MMSRVLLGLAIALVTLECYLVNAHYTMIYPTSRGFNEDTEPTAPCGGFDSVSSSRVKVPKNAFVTINSGHVSYSYQINAVYSNNPNTSDFSGSAVKQLAQGTRSYPEASCLAFQFGSDVQDGTNATLQIVYNGGDGMLYQCVDVTVDSSASYNSSMCYNADSSTTNTSGNSSSTATTGSGNTSLGSSVTVTTGLTLMVAVGISFLLA
ncbi:uncharacterized protein B0P05DRAFT_475496 [Gilbertella persicaria]|uniref:uncharacterized protein n=1 Tax=Gilbertella persicaria TaxID=101096 RepID=UPI00221F44AD|nr:uncharacterized protein B0P05DRAFT_475496 [Gilbertella persicaria]KAI8066966.1 hypothetical protein B0P05DRAFT_475496 [Gilbertella persicaria]